ncbi:MAG: hypothetical protein K2I70_01025 [Bacilli bacterium]|nr:hypothetical protein [Bacilli bacterium]
MLKSLGVFQDHTDGSLKSVFVHNENQIIEMTLLFNKPNKDVVCVPSHPFCNLGCKMCHLTNNNLNKCMVPIKFENFKEALYKSLRDVEDSRITDKKKLLISFMGVGEPLLNLGLIEEVFKHEEKIKEELGYENISYAISTMMPNDNVKKLTALVNDYSKPLKLHFSLHTPIDSERKELIPSTNVSVTEALDLLDYYRHCVKKNSEFVRAYGIFHEECEPIEIHYTLIKGVNDGEEELNLITTLLSRYNIPIKFIRFNPKTDMSISENEDKWVSTIENVAGVKVKTYSPPGREIGSSCGEFTKHYYHEELETEEERQEFLYWEKKHKVILTKKVLE